MKIDRSRVRKSTSEVPLECQQLIERLQQCSRTELLDELSRIHSWTFGKCELLHWAQVLDIFDKILGEAAERSPENKWVLKCDTYIESELNLLICILRFTSLLIEHSFSRHLYNSMEHLLVLQECNEMSVVLEVLNLLYMFSKRSNFITRLKTEEKESLLIRLSCLGESWGGKENGFGLADCCNPEKEIPSSATTLHVEFHPEDETKSLKFPRKDAKASGKPNFHIIHIEHINKLRKTPAEIMKSLISIYYVPPDKEVWLFTHVRLATHFADYQSRLKMVQARLQALSVIVYSNAIQEVSSNLLYNGLLEELVEVVELQDPHLSDIRCAALRTLTAIIHLDRGPHLNRRPTASRLNNIIDVTGASLYHGFLPALVRNCIASLTNQVDCGQSAFKKMKLQDSISETDDFNINTSTGSNMSNFGDSVVDTTMEFKPHRVLAPSVTDSKYPVSLTTALFSFLYHLASYQAGGEALVSCGMMESLLQVINWQGFELDHINFVTRAVRVIDLITNIDMTAFQTYGGLYSFINRLDIEVNFCKKEQIYRVSVRNVDQILDETFVVDSAIGNASVPSTSSSSIGMAGPSTIAKEMEEDTPAVNNADIEYVPENTGKSCLPQRAALLKSMLNFLKKAFNDAAFSESIRHLMEGTLPNSLKNLIANAEYYGPSLFLLATDVVTVYVYQEPSLLSALQENGLTDIILYSLLVKEVPATREVLGSLPNVFSALCLNNRGLEAFAKYNPFEKLFNILLSPNYLPAMRRRRSSEPTNDTASVLGNAMDELMRHQPSLRQDATMAIISLLEELVYMGKDPKFVCWRPHSKSDTLPPNNSRSANNTEGSSDEEDDDEEEASTSSQNAQTERMESQPQVNSERQPIALIDYILNAMKFIDSILSNNSTDDHCREFCERGGIVPLLQILGLPNLPVDCPVTNPAQAVATVCKSILNLAHEPFLFSQGLTQLGGVLENLKPLYARTGVPGASKLLLELVNCTDLETAFSTATATPILHAMNAAHGYVIMFVHICRTGQTEIRNLSLQRWGSLEGLAVLKGLSELYTSLVWESTLLLAYCSDDLLPSDCEFTREDIEKLNAFFDKCEGASGNSSGSTSDNNTPAASTPGSIALANALNSAALDALTANYAMELDSDVNINKDSRNIKIIKPLLGASSRLGRALAELFGLLVKLCVGPPVRQRRGQNIISTPQIPSVYATNVATALNKLLVDGLDCEKLPSCPNPKCRLTFLICSIGFTSPMLFDERRYPYHLMLKKFISLDGQNTLFRTFQWALDLRSGSPADPIDYGALPEGTLGFLDAWLTLVEKLVNPKTVIESPHVISNRSGNSFGFDPFNYLKRIHRQAFENVKLLWKKQRAPYGERTTETLLTIMRHIFRGEKLIKEKLKSEENKTDGGSTSTAGPSSDPAGLRQLVDMGFSRESALEALQHTSSLEHATEYLLSNPSHLSRSTNSMDVGLEEDQVQQAIAISLENSVPGTSADSTKPTPEEQDKLFDDAINEFAANALEEFLKLLDELPDTVHKVCDLLVTLMKRNPIEYSERIFDALIEEMMKIIHYLSFYIFNNSISIVNYYSILLSEPPQRLHSILHLFILLFESPFCSYMKGKCGLKLYKKRATTITVTLITRVVDMMSKLRAIKEPKWLAPAILFVDLLAKADVCHTRKIYMHLTTTRIWRWYDLVTGRWAQYSNNNNRLINEAYWAGEPSIRVTCGRKRYTITFGNMLQVNDETGNNRPICMTLATFSHPNCSDVNGTFISEPLYTELTPKEENRSLPILGGTTFDQKLMLLKATCDLLSLPTLDKNILHSALQLSARLTRDYEMAKVFVHNGGVKSILAMRQLPEFNGFGVLSTILIRHALEEPNTLHYSIEKIIRGKTLSTIPPPYKDLIYMIRQISGAVARHPYIFWYVAAEILRIDITNYKGESPEVSLPVRVEPPTRSKAPPLEDACSFEVMSDLLKALLEPLEDKNVGDHERPFATSPLKSKLNETETVKETVVTTFSKVETTSCPGSVTTSNASSQTEEELLTPLVDSTTGSTSDGTAKSTEGNAQAEEEDLRTPEEKERSGFKNPAKKPMLPKSVIIKILSDAVVSYGPIAKIITDYKYKASDSEFLTEDTTALAFIFDKLLPLTPNLSDGDTSTMARMLLAALASSNHAPEAQISLVSEVKYALIRALNLPESSEKHHQIQNICGIISTMIDNCPLPHTNRWTNCSVNNIVKLMIRRGIFNDLAKVTHYLDLSSPHTPFTVNSTLKPLESLSRTINQPGPGGNQSKNRKSSQHAQEDTTEPPTSSTEQTNAQGEELEDTENTEHDISAVASSLENNSVSTGRLDNAFEHMMQHILQHRSDNSQGYNDVPSSRNTTMDIDEECTIDYDHERDATEELMSTDSGESDSNPSDQVDDDGNDDNDGDDDNIDDNDDNDDNNYYDDDNDRRRGGGAMFRLAANDRDEDILMIQYETETNNAIPRMIRWNENGFTVPMLENPTTIEPPGTITHPLLISRQTFEAGQNATRNQRTNRTRRYQYLFSPRNPNPPVILQRLLGPDDPHLTNVLSSANNFLNLPDLRENARVVVMDNFGILPSHEEQIDFVDQSGYLFGPSLAATLSHIPPILHWWNIESKLLDMESTNDAVMFVCNKLIPMMINIRNEELRNKKSKEKDDIAKKTKQRSNPEASCEPETASNTVAANDEEPTHASAPPSEPIKQGGTDLEDIDGVPIPTVDLTRDEDLDGDPVEISDTSNESSDGDVLLSRLPSFLRGNENSQTSDVTQNASVQTIDSSEARAFNNRSETSDTNAQNQSNPFEMSLTAYVRSRNNAFGRPVGSPFQQHIENLLETQGEPVGLDVQTHNNPLRAILEESVSQQSESPSSEQPTSQTVETSTEPSTAQQREPEPDSAEPSTSASTSENSSNAAEQSNAPVVNADVVIAGPSSSNDDEEIPEGVDPSFLEALPPEIRREVLEQHRILCIQQRYRAAQEAGEEYVMSTPQVSPDFLAALPPSLQEEVLSQHRMELQRQAAARANPDEPVDAASFFETLQPSLRTMILSDMEDSQMSALPPDLAQEAQNLRRDWYARNRQMAQERFLQTNLSAIYRHSRGRQSLRPNNFHRGGWGQWSRDFVSNSAVSNNQAKIRGRQLLDHEGISCLLILLFTDDSHLNKLRLHRVLRNLCYHAPTREWVINSLLSIIEKSVNVQADESLNKPAKKVPKPGPLTSKLLTDTRHLQNGGHWLTIRMEAALGCAANVFILNKATGKKSDKSSGANTISIHPQAAPIVCRNTLDLLTSLAKAFPSCLIPVKSGREESDQKALTPVKLKPDSSDFWDVLIRLDCSTKKGKSIQKQSNSSSMLSDCEISITFEQTAFGKLLNMLASPVVKRNTQLTDNLLKLLSVTTSGMPDLGKSHKPGRGRSVATEIINKPPTNALNLVVNVITYQNCSEEGLEFITHLLLNLANSSLDMSFMILNLLLNGAVEIGGMVEQQIQDMLKDLRDLIGSTQKRKLEETSGPSSSKGVIFNRFTNEQVIVTASTKVKSACELQLPSMVPLTSKSSSQVFFLRVLRVIVQIRNSIKQSMKKADSTFYELPALSEQLTSLDSLWNSLSLCLFELEHAPDHHAVLVLQPTVEAFFLVHSPQQGAAKQDKKDKDEEESAQGGSESEATPPTRKMSKTETQEQAEAFTDSDKTCDSTSSKPAVNPEQHFLAFAETHRAVLNQILRQSTSHLADGPFAVLVDHTRILDFDIKRRYFRTELERMDHGVRREETAVHVRRSNIFEDSFRELFRRPPEEWKNRFYIVFEDEEGQDAGGLLREWYVIISRDIFNPMYALFTVSPGDRVTYMINSASHYNSNHLCYYKFVGRVIAKAIYDNKLLECYFTRSFYKHILGIPVKYTDMESEDYSFYRGLVYLMENNISNMDIDLTFSTEISEFGVTETRDLIPNGRHIAVTEENKMEYIRLVCQMKMTGAIKQQLNSFLEGFYDIIPMRLISIFNEQELELLISGLPNVDIEDLKANTEYHKYQTNSLQIQWFWRALRSFDQADRAKFLQFVTGTSKVPLQGFGALEGMNGVQKFQIHRDDRSTDRLPSAHTCFNQLDLPVYETYDKLRAYLLKAIHECSEGFGFA